MVGPQTWWGTPKEFGRSVKTCDRKIICEEFTRVELTRNKEEITLRLTVGTLPCPPSCYIVSGER